MSFGALELCEVLVQKDLMQAVELVPQHLLQKPEARFWFGSALP